MTSDERPPLHLGDYPQGAHWSAAIGRDDEGLESYAVSGTSIRFAPEDTVEVPLWDADGLLPEDPVWLNRALGLSAELVADLAAWGEDWNAPRGGQRFTLDEQRQRQVRLDAEAHALVDRLREELPPGFTVELAL